MGGGGGRRERGKQLFSYSTQIVKYNYCPTSTNFFFFLVVFFSCFFFFFFFFLLSNCFVLKCELVRSVVWLVGWFEVTNVGMQLGLSAL